MSKISKFIFPFLTGKISLKNPPFKVWIEITNLCNQNCLTCPNNMISEDKKRSMSIEEFSKISNALPKDVEEVNLFHRGEPFLHKDLLTFIKILKNKGKFVRLYTNGTLLKKTFPITKLFENPPDMIAFSVPNPLLEQTNDKNEYLNTSLKNLESLLAFRKQKKVKKIFIKLEILSLGKEKDAKAKKHLKDNYKLQTIDSITFRGPHNWGGNIESFDIDKKRKHNQCTFPWYALVIFADGTVTTCPQDFFGNLALGNIFDDDLQTIWNSKKMHDLRKLHVKRNIEEGHPCYNCDRIHRKTFLKVPLEYLRIF